MVNNEKKRQIALWILRFALAALMVMAVCSIANMLAG